MSSSETWQDMTAEQKAEAIKAVYKRGITIGGIAYRVGATKDAVTAFYRNHRELIPNCLPGLKVNRPVSSEEMETILRMKRAGHSLVEISEAAGLHWRVVAQAAGMKLRQHTHAVDAKKKSDLSDVVIINDYPDSLTAALCGDPTPMRRQLMQEGRI